MQEKLSFCGVAYANELNWEVFRQNIEVTKIPNHILQQQNMEFRKSEVKMSKKNREAVAIKEKYLTIQWVGFAAS